MSWTRRRKVLAGFVGVFAALALGYGIAAVVVQSFTGTAGGKTRVIAVASPVFVEVTAAEITNSISPGQTGSLIFHVNNPNGAALTWTDLTCASLPCDQQAVIEVTGASGVCNNSNFTFIPRSGLNIPIGPGPQVQYVVEVPGTISMAASAGPGCDGATVEASGLLATFSKP
jgi:hypothetical protein